MLIKNDLIDINLLTNGNFENAKMRWNTYKDTAAASPVDGTGGTPSFSSFSVTSTTPIIGSTSGQFVKSGASNAQGEGWSIDFTVQPAQKGKVLTISGQYQVASGTYSGGTPSTDSDVTMYIYDVDAAQVIQPTGYKLNGSVSDVTYDILGTFQTNPTSSNYRLIFHIASTTTSTFTLKVDAMCIAKRNGVISSVVQDLGAIAWTPTGSWTTNSTYTGAWGRVGNRMRGWVKIALAGAPTATSLTVNIPTGYVIDTTKINAADNNSDALGSGTTKSANNTYGIVVAYESTTSLRLRASTSSANTLLAFISNTSPATYANGDNVTFWFEVPIQGWASGAIVSSESDTRVVAATMRIQSSGTVPASTTAVTFQDTKIDTHAGWNGTNAYTIKIPGVYKLTVTATISPAASTAGTYFGAFFVNGTQQSTSVGVGLPSINQHYTGAQEMMLQLNAGDVVDYRNNQNTGSTVNVIVILFNVQRISGPNQILPTETIAASYSNAATQAVTANVTNFTYDTRNYDTHLIYSAGVFTIPVAGKWRISSLEFNASSSGQDIQIWKNGSKAQGIYRIVSTGGVAGGSAELNLVAGDQISIRSNSSYTRGGSANDNILNIIRVGN